MQTDFPRQRKGMGYRYFRKSGINRKKHCYPCGGPIHGNPSGEIQMHIEILRRKAELFQQCKHILRRRTGIALAFRRSLPVFQFFLLYDARHR